MNTNVNTAQKNYNQWIGWYPGAIRGAAQRAVQAINSKHELAALITKINGGEYVTRMLIVEFDHRNDDSD
jgi:hypothetical protein